MKKSIRKQIGVILAGAAILTPITACGTGTSSTNSSSNNSSSSDISGFVQNAQAASKSTPVAFSGPTQPAKAPKNIKIALIASSASLHGTEAPVDSAAAAAQTLGWQVQKYDGGGDPAQQNKDMLNAIAWGANVIVNIAVDPNLVQQGLQAANKAGVLVVSGSNGLDTPNPAQSPSSGKLGYALDVAPNYFALGAATADWIIADSKGKANIVVFSDKEFPSVLALQNGLLSELKKCSTITLQPLQYFTGNQVGSTLNQQTTGYLSTHPDVNYIFSPFDPAAASQVTAIQQAGMAKDVKLVSVLGDQQNLNFIRNGQVQYADAAYDNQYMGWAIVDQVIRSLDKQSLYSPHGENLPYVILDKNNLPPDGTDWTAPFDYKSTFAGLWK